MKSIAYQFISLSVFFAVLFAATSVFAQEDNSDTDTDESTTTLPSQTERREAIEAIRQEVNERRETIQENVAERREEIQTTVAEQRASLEARVQTRIINLAANLSNRMDAVVTRFENIIGRLESRIETLSQRGLDTSAAEIALEDAKDNLNKAKVALTTIDQVVYSSVTSESPREAWQATKVQYATIRQDIANTHAALRTTIAALKSALPLATETASTTDNQ